MDPKVCGKLLTHHRRGYGLDVQALHDRIPLRQITEKGPRWDLTGTEVCGSGKVVSWLPLMFLGYKSIYRQKKYVDGAPCGPWGWGRTYPPWARPPASWPPHGVPDFNSKSSGLLLVQERSSRRFHSVWIPFDIPFLRNNEIGKKQQFAVGLCVIGY